MRECTLSHKLNTAVQRRVRAAQKDTAGRNLPTPKLEQCDETMPDYGIRLKIICFSLPLLHIRSPLNVIHSLVETFLCARSIRDIPVSMCRALRDVQFQCAGFLRNVLVSVYKVYNMQCLLEM